MTALPHEERVLPRMTVEEYLTFEETAELKHEFVHGEVVAMSGGSGNHSKLGGRVFSVLDRALDGGPCETFNDAFRVSIRSRGQYRYPDASVRLRAALETPPEERRQLTMLNAKALFEVLSPSTEAADRGEKFELYRQIPTFVLYVLVHSERGEGRDVRAQSNGLWSIDLFEGLDAVVELRAPRGHDAAGGALPRHPLRHGAGSADRGRGTVKTATVRG